MKPTSTVLVRAAIAGVVLSASVLGVRTAGAQTPDARWQPWLGCWVASDEASSGVASANGADGMVCVVPAALGAGVEVATIANGVVAHRERLDATGARVAKTVDNCPGWESATWSADSRRLMMRSEYVCGNNVRVRGSGVFAISADGEWIQVQGNSVGASTSARAVRYRASGLQLERAAVGQESDSTRVHLVTGITGFATVSARSVAGETLRAENVLEVARNVDGPVAEAWLIEIGQPFAVDAGELVRLADAGMPSKMIDLMVALSYPQRFAVQRTDPVRLDVGNRGATSGAGAGYGRLDGYGSRWECGYGDRMLSYGYYGSGCYPSYYGLSSRGYGYGYGYGYDVYGRYGYNGGYNGGYGGYYGGPIVIVPRQPDTSPRIEGRAVNGAGYTRRNSQPSSSSSNNRSSASSGSSSSSSSGSASSGSSGSSSSGAGASSSSSGSASSSGSSGGDRTAKPRVPPG